MARGAVQMWIVPRSRGLTPNYGSASFAPEARRNRWAHLVGDVGGKEAKIAINQDANVYATELDAGARINFSLGAGRQAYLVCLEGALRLAHAKGAEELDMHEACEVGGQQALELSAGPAGAHCLLVEMRGAVTG